MNTGNLPPHAPRGVLPYVLAYLLWLLSVAASLAAVIQLRSTVNVLWVALGGSRWSLGLANQVSLLIGSLVAFVYVLYLEGYYRDAARRGAPLLRRFALTIAVPLGVLLLALALGELALRGMF